MMKTMMGKKVIAMRKATAMMRVARVMMTNITQRYHFKKK